MNFWELVFKIIALHQILYWSYLWQLKEYRRDRLSSALKTDFYKIIFDQFNLRFWFRPKPTARGVMTVLLAIFFGLFLSGFYLVILVPITTALAVGLVSPVFILYKKYLVLKAGRRMENFRGVVIGITGSYGKSSTKEILATVLEKKYQVGKTPHNVNSEIGVAQTALKLNGNEEIFIVEMGAYKQGEIGSICRIVHPQIGVITGLGDQHLELFGSLENLKRAKYELIDALPKGGLALVAGKDFTLSEAKEIRVFKDHVEFNYQNQKFTVPVLGVELIRNVIAVIKICQNLGMTLAEISMALGEFKNNAVYPHMVKLNEDVYIVDDSYNTSYESFLSTIEYLKIYHGFTKILVTPGIIELGDRGKTDHVSIGEKLNFVDKVFVTAKTYFPELNSSGKAQLVTKNLLRELKAWKKPKTVFVFKGRVSRVIINGLYD